MPVIDALLPKAIASVCSKSTSADLWAETLAPFMWVSGIMSPFRIAAFVGQVAWESSRFTVMSENLNYSAARMVQVWPARFAGPNAPDPVTCANNPEMLANVVYANRLGNGGFDSGDGWRYRGAGLIQLTGKETQLKFASDARLDPATIGDYLRTPKGAAQSAVWFWQTRNLNRLADLWLLTRLSESINGGTDGLAERIALCSTVRKALGA